MEYTYTQPDRRFRGPVHWGHCISLFVADKRKHEFFEFLDEVVGKDQWRIAGAKRKADYKRKLELNKFWGSLRLLDQSKPPRIITTRVKFLDKNHAFRVKLMWDECERPKLDKITFLPGGGALKWQTHVMQKMHMNSVFPLSAGRGSGKSMMAAKLMQDMLEERITQTGREKVKELTDKILTYVDTEASFDFSKVRAQGERISMTVIDEAGDTKMLSLPKSTVEQIKKAMK